MVSHLNSYTRMNHLELIEKIITKLTEEGFTDLANQVSEVQASASFGSELIMIVSHTLLKIKKTHEAEYSTITPEVEELIKYANSIGLYPK
jgi:hypothetical protein